MRTQVGVWLILGLLAGTLSAGVARADDAPKTEPSGAQAAPNPPASDPSKPSSSSSDRKKKDTFEALRDYRIHLDYFPVGLVVPAGKLRFTELIPMHPAGFRANEYSMYLSPVYGLGDGWELTAGVTGAQRLGRGGEALFGGVGVQKQFHKETHVWPALSVGVYGMTGPHEHHSGTFYAVGSKRVWGGEGRKLAVYLHGGVRYERFGSNDYGESSGVRPFGGITAAVSKHLFFTGEISPPQPWEIADVYSIRSTYLIHKSIGVSGGIRGDGYRTYPFAEVVF